MQAVGTVSLVSAILFLPYLAAVYIYMMPVSLGPSRVPLQRMCKPVDRITSSYSLQCNY